jgi:hypothetical protein
MFGTRKIWQPWQWLNCTIFEGRKRLKLGFKKNTF